MPREGFGPVPARIARGRDGGVGGACEISETPGDVPTGDVNASLRARRIAAVWIRGTRARVGTRAGYFRMGATYLGAHVVVSALVAVRAVAREVIRAHRGLGRVHRMAEPTRRPVAAGAVQIVLTYLSRRHVRLLKISGGERHGGPARRAARCAPRSSPSASRLPDLRQLSNPKPQRKRT